MISKNRFALVAAALVVVGFAGSFALGIAGANNGPRTQAAWVFKARTLGQLSARAGAIVVATAGPSMHSRFAFSDNGEDSLPFEITDFTVIRSIVGPAEGSVINVERAGGLDVDGVTHVEIDADGGAFVQGATYLLFLEQQEGTSYYFTLNDQARFQLRGDRLDAIDEDDSVARLLHGENLTRATALIRRSLGQ